MVEKVLVVVTIRILESQNVSVFGYRMIFNGVDPDKDDLNAELKFKDFVISIDGKTYYTTKKRI